MAVHPSVSHFLGALWYPRDYFSLFGRNLEPGGFAVDRIFCENFDQIVVIFIDPNVLLCTASIDCAF